MSDFTDWVDFLSMLPPVQIDIAVSTIAKTHGLISDGATYENLVKLAYAIKEKELKIEELKGLVLQLESSAQCNCGGDCKDKQPEILCFKCKKNPWDYIARDRDANSWWYLPSTAMAKSDCRACVNMGTRGRVFTKCNAFEPKEEE